VTQFGEKKPRGANATEISEKLKRESNVVKFKELVEIDFHRASGKEIPISLDVQIKLVNFELSDAARKRVERQVRAIYKVYVNWFGWAHQASRPIVIKIFGKFKEFEDYQVKNSKFHVTNRSHYSNVRREVVMLGTEFEDATLGVLFHEVSHAIVHMGLRGTPSWINEGFSEIFESSTVKRGEIVFGYKLGWAEIMQHKLREGSLRPFGEYLAISNKEWRNSPARVEYTYYMIAGSMMHFLITSDDAGLKAIRAVINSGKLSPWWRPPSLPERFEQNYPGGLKKLDARWRSWIRGLALN